MSVAVFAALLPILAAGETTKPAKPEEARKPAVLLVAGHSGWEYTHLKNMLLRQDAIRADVLLQDAGAEPAAPKKKDAPAREIGKLPRSAEQVAAYDVIILMDPAFAAEEPADDSDDRRISPAWAGRVAKQVAERGTGLLFAAGKQYTAEMFADKRFAALRDLLPVEPAPPVAEPAAGTKEGRPLSWTEAGRSHALFAFVDHKNPAEAAKLSAETAERLPPVFWVLPAAKINPAAAILAVHDSPDTRVGAAPLPLIAEMKTGRGRALYLGFDSTWRWRSLGEAVFEGFWTRAIRSLADVRIGERGASAP